ncbi:IS607 family transposase [Deinococcus sp. Arct2-2]|nr:IS607 family transposase [Deinococcus sp. Arct2-2]
MRIGDAARYLKMSVVGVRAAAAQGRIPSVITAGNQRRFRREDLDSYLGLPVAEAVSEVRERTEALYCRMSGSGDQASSLVNQEAALRESATGPVFRVYKDQASGLSERRTGLDQLLDDAARRKFTVVRVTHQDRLARFGVRYLERYLTQCGVTVEVLHQRADASLHQELMQDFMSLLASCAGRLYRLRSHENQLRVLSEAHKELQGKQEKGS